MRHRKVLRQRERARESAKGGKPRKTERANTRHGGSREAEGKGTRDQYTRVSVYTCVVTVTVPQNKPARFSIRMHSLGRDEVIMKSLPLPLVRSLVRYSPRRCVTQRRRRVSLHPPPFPSRQLVLAIGKTTKEGYIRIGVLLCVLITPILSAIIKEILQTLCDSILLILSPFYSYSGFANARL